ncbi:hypothetical protein FRC01_008621 [Tulasnella sp. 417]|nr:hypothetical protein FRC01_008621 [Tulasnella sp. 417]
MASTMSASQDATLKISAQSHLNISNIPYDIFLLIVFLCWNHGQDDEARDFPIIASHVCRTWRSYALDTGLLWATLEFHGPEPHRAITKYKVWLERTRGSPLDIFIGSQPFKGASVKHAKSIMRLIMPHVSRWRSFQVGDVPEKIIRLICDGLRDVSAPMLEVLEVVGAKHIDPYEAFIASTLKLKPFDCGEAAGLKQLVLEGYPHVHLVNRFSTLQALQLRNASFFKAGATDNLRTIKHILSSLPGLLTLYFDCGIRGSIPNTLQLSPQLNTPPPRIHHPSLVKLAIYLPNGDRDAILSSLDLPKVQYFFTRLHFEGVLGLNLLPILSQCHPFTNLISLRIGGRAFFAAGPPPHVRCTYSGGKDLDHLEGALAGLPQLKVLTFDTVRLDGGEWLVCVGRTCPRLQRLTFRSCTGSTLLPMRAVVEERLKRPGLDALVQLTIWQWQFGGVEIDSQTDEWLKQTLIFHVKEPIGDSRGWTT